MHKESKIDLLFNTIVLPNINFALSVYATFKYNSFMNHSAVRHYLPFHTLAIFLNFLLLLVTQNLYLYLLMNKDLIIIIIIPIRS